jgi:hypothetical protein
VNTAVEFNVHEKVAVNPPSAGMVPVKTAEPVRVRLLSDTGPFAPNVDSVNCVPGAG